MNLNQAGINLIKQFEGCKLHAYPDPATGGKPWTIGYGCTGVDIGPNTIWTQEQADRELDSRLQKLCKRIKSELEVNLNDNQFSAVVSLVWNIGMGNFIGHDLLKFLNAGAFKMASQEFPLWNKANGKVMPGLTRRRLAEKELFDS